MDMRITVSNFHYWFVNNLKHFYKNSHRKLYLIVVSTTNVNKFCNSRISPFLCEERTLSASMTYLIIATLSSYISFPLTICCFCRVAKRLPRWQQLLDLCSVWWLSTPTFQNTSNTCPALKVCQLPMATVVTMVTVLNNKDYLVLTMLLLHVMVLDTISIFLIANYYQSVRANCFVCTMDFLAEILFHSFFVAVFLIAWFIAD